MSKHKKRNARHESVHKAPKGGGKPSSPSIQTVAARPSSLMHSWPAPTRPSGNTDNYRFLNPYNFVRYLPAPNIPAYDHDARLLGRCMPPPHDRSVGLSGRITCILTAVTPLFISDSHDVRVTPIISSTNKSFDHKSYRFFQYEGRDAIPATSLRGMIRSLFEAVTNAPFSVFNSDARLEYRIDPDEARRFKPGIVRSLPQGDQPGVIELCEEAKIGAYYDDSNQNVLHGNWRCGEEAFAIIGKDKNNVPKVDGLNRRRESFSDTTQPVHGWVKKTGRTIETKRNESFFYFKHGSGQKVFFDAEREADFNAILHAQLHERSEDFHTEVQSKRLAPGNLVYVELEANDQTWARNIALVKVARLRYRHSIGDLLPEHLQPSTQYDQLDIASRVFGWVKGKSPDNPTERVAYAGRVRFSHATLIEDKGVYAEDMPLAILSSPKPTTTLFYLRNINGIWSDEERKKPGAATTIGYDGANQLRGRKFYRHHGAQLNRMEYERADRRRDHQNRSVRGVRAPGNVFRFTIDFHNLAPVELGALLWTLNLSSDEGYFFRLGYAKPLGFGSVRLEVEEVELLDLGARYASLRSSGWRRAAALERSDWIARFAEAMKRCYGQPLGTLPNIADLKALLSEPQPALPVHYPRTSLQPDPEGKNFEWFVTNKSKSRKPEKAGPNLPLADPGQAEALPLLSTKTQ